MGYHPETLVCSFPPFAFERDRWIKRAFFRLSPLIGFDIWHIDPEKSGTGNRRDDSCGWFDRTSGPYAGAVAEILNDKDMIQTIANTVDMEVFWRSAYLDDYPEDRRGWHRVTPSDALALTLMVGRRLEHARYWAARRSASWWRKPFVRKHDMDGLLIDLALNPGDNLAPSKDSHKDYPQSFILLLAASMHRQIKPWWKHPRWHLHHWKVTFHLVRNLRRMRQRCATCRKRLGFGYCPTQSGGKLHHGQCLGTASAKVGGAGA